MNTFLTPFASRRVLRALAVALALKLAIYHGAAAQKDALPLHEAPGAFGFPQKQAKVLCDTAELRFSVCNDGQYLFAQAVVWKDGDPALGKTNDGREIGDWSDLCLELGDRGTITPNVDRQYALNPWPRLPGLRYQVSLSEHSWTGLQGNSKGRGAIRYLDLSGTGKVRVDSYLIPLEEIGKRPGETIRLCYWGFSPSPALTVNSAAYDAHGRSYYSYSIPHAAYHDYVISEGGSIDATQVPQDRSVREPEASPASPKPDLATGSSPHIKFTAVDGREVDLAKLRGKVVLIDFWATWCGPCMGELPHVLEAYQKYHDKGFEIIGISFDHDKSALERVTREKGMVWPQYFDGKGWQNAFGQQFGIHGIPTMWLIGKDGRIVTTNGRNELAGQVAKLLGLPPDQSTTQLPPKAAPPTPTPRIKPVDLGRLSTKLNPTTMARSASSPLSGTGPLLARYSFDASTPESGAELRNVPQHDGVIDLNGIYEHATGGNGYHAIFKTPTLDYQKFTVVVRLFADPPQGRSTPLLVGGTSYRWFALNANSSGELTLTMNNGRFHQPVGDAKIKFEEWTTLVSSVDLAAHEAAVYVNGRLAARIRLPDDFKLDVVGSNAEQRDKEWAFQNYSYGGAFKGLVGELAIFNTVLDEQYIRKF